MRDEHRIDPMYGEAKRALVRIGAPAVPALIDSVKDRDSHMSDIAISALGEIKDPRAVAVLLGVVSMAHNNSVVFGHLGDALNALDAIGDPGSIQPLIAQLNRPPDDGRVRISMGLAGFGAPAIDPLIAALSSRDANVRQGAADALGRASEYKLTRDPRAIAVLNAAMAARNREIVSAAYYYFAQRREPGDEDFLIRLLMEAGEREGFSMASYCLNFGSPPLRAAAERWAHAHGVRINIIQE
jgi:HEAT repeat protein